jgi:hypothetical protein
MSESDLLVVVDTALSTYAFGTRSSLCVGKAVDLIELPAKSTVPLTAIVFSLSPSMRVLSAVSALVLLVISLSIRVPSAVSAVILFYCSV